MLRSQPLPADQARDIELVIDMLLEKRYAEATMICVRYPRERHFQFLREMVAIYQRESGQVENSRAYSDWVATNFGYLKSGECPGEILAAILRDFSPTLTYPVMDIIPDRFEEGNLIATDLLVERLIGFLKGNREREKYYAARGLGGSGDPRAIEPLKEQLKIYEGLSTYQARRLAEAMAKALAAIENKNKGVKP